LYQVYIFIPAFKPMHIYLRILTDSVSRTTGFAGTAEFNERTCRLFMTEMHCSYQDSKTNVMHFSFNLLRIKSLYMFRALLAHPQQQLCQLAVELECRRRQFHSNLGAAN
jgi:hypothetical protein